MRTGAIFARGSCRALKWMALFGVVFMLGAGSADAQATISGATWTPESADIKFNMSAAVWTRGGTETAADFTVSWTNPAGSSAKGTMHDIPSARDDAKSSFTITLDKVVPTAAGTVTVTYTEPPDADGVNDRGILDNTSAHGHTVTATGVSVAENTAIAPTIPTVENRVFKKDDAITAFHLPAAMGNAVTGGAQYFTYLVTDLPSGLTFTADPDGTANNDDDRRVDGTPDTVTNGAQSVRYVATDADGQSSSATFTITVNDVPDAPDAPNVTSTANTSGSLTVRWDAPAANNSPIIYYEVRHKKTADAAWLQPNTRVLQGESFTFTREEHGLAIDTSYDFQVQAINAVGPSGYSATGMGTPVTSAAAPAVPAIPVVTRTRQGSQDVQGSLDVTWAAPADNGSAITGYGLRYMVEGAATWTVMNTALPATPTSTTLAGLPDATTYHVQVNAQNANGMSAWSASGEGTTAPALVLPDLKGQITAIEVTNEDGSEWEKRGEVTIGSAPRVHVEEGEINAFVSVTVQWDHAEITDLRAAGVRQVRIWLELQGAFVHEQIYALSGNWLSWIDDEGDVDFPNTTSRLGELGGWIEIPLPPAPREFPNSIRHHDDETGRIRLLIHHDQHEAENDAFYVEATHSPDVDLGASDARNLSTPLIVIEDDDPQKVVITRKTPKKPTPIYESDGSAVFTVTADPERQDLPLGVRLDMVELGETTVSSEALSLSTAALTLNAAKDGVSSSSDVTVHLPASDGNRVDDKYELHASVNLYSLASGAFDEIFTAKEAITVIDVHKLPWLTVSSKADVISKTGVIAEGDEDGIDLTLIVNRNPKITRAVDPETREYTSEALSIAVNGSGVDALDYMLSMDPVTVSRHNGRSPWEQKVKVNVKANKNEDIGEKMLALEFVVNGTEDHGPRPSVADGASEDDYNRSMDTVTLTIEDETMKKVAPKAAAEVQAAVDLARDAAAGDEGLNPEESFMVMTSDLFTVATGYTAEYAVSSSSSSVSASATVDSVSIMANSVGEAEITVTATATGMSSATTSQTTSNVAQVMFKVVVTERNLTLKLSAPEGHDGNIAEGGTVRLMATTNRPVGADTIVELVYMGGTASAADYEADSIAIKMGEMEGSTLLMAVEDSMAEDMETLMIEGRIGGLKSNGLSFNLWDAAVPALPVIAQLLLAALMAVGGYRRYRRR